jgi:hypothetical protein
MGQNTARAISTSDRDKDELTPAKQAPPPQAPKPKAADLAYGCVDWYIYEDRQFEPNRAIN